MNKYDVHMFEVWRAKYVGVEAESPGEAAKMVSERCCELLRSDEFEFAEEVVDVLVDHYLPDGTLDKQYEKSAFYTEDGHIRLLQVCPLCQGTDIVMAKGYALNFDTAKIKCHCENCGAYYEALFKFSWFATKEEDDVEILEQPLFGWMPVRKLEVTHGEDACSGDAGRSDRADRPNDVGPW